MSIKDRLAMFEKLNSPTNREEIIKSPKVIQQKSNSTPFQTNILTNTPLNSDSSNINPITGKNISDNKAPTLSTNALLSLLKTPVPLSKTQSSTSTSTTNLTSPIITPSKIEIELLPSTPMQISPFPKSQSTPLYSYLKSESCNKRLSLENISSPQATIDTSSASLSVTNLRTKFQNLNTSNSNLRTPGNKPAVPTKLNLNTPKSEINVGDNILSRGLNLNLKHKLNMENVEVNTKKNSEINDSKTAENVFTSEAKFKNESSEPLIENSSIFTSTTGTKRRTIADIGEALGLNAKLANMLSSKPRSVSYPINVIDREVEPVVLTHFARAAVPKSRRRNPSKTNVIAEENLKTDMNDD